jgi:hypothetical protein
MDDVLFITIGILSGVVVILFHYIFPKSKKTAVTLSPELQDMHEKLVNLMVEEERHIAELQKAIVNEYTLPEQDKLVQTTAKYVAYRACFMIEYNRRCQLCGHQSMYGPPSKILGELDDILSKSIQSCESFSKLLVKLETDGTDTHKKQASIQLKYASAKKRVYWDARLAVQKYLRSRRHQI